MKSTIVLAALISLVAGHGAIIKATSPNGGSGMALGVNTATPRDGTKRDPFQADSTRFKGDNKATVGQTLGGGENDLQAGTAAIMAETGDMLPQIVPGGKIQMTVHQVNGDGAGPYDCMVNSDGTAQTWAPMKVTTNVPGTNSRDRAGAMKDFPLEAAIPAGQSCTGQVAGQNNVCLVRCQNGANAGPFGGVVPTQMAVAGNTTVNTPAAARRALAAVVRSNALMLKARSVAPANDDEDDDEDDE